MEPKAILLLDNAGSHPAEDILITRDGKIFAIFMPPNVTSLIQPMDQNIIRITKLYYRTHLLTSIVAKSSDPSEVLKSLSLKDAVINLHVAWEKIDETLISKCWKAILPNEEEDPDDNVPLSVLRAECNRERISAIAEISQALSVIVPTAEFSHKEIDAWNEDSGFREDQDDDFSSDGEITGDPDQLAKMSVVDGVQMLNGSIEWAEQNSEDGCDIAVLRKMRAKAVLQMIQKKQKQTKVSDYFSK